MKKLVVYFHGFGSSPNSPKVDRLREEFDTLAVNIDIDPDVAYWKVMGEIDHFLLDYTDEDIELIFVGTSLGGWWASCLAEVYDCLAVVINPSTNPSNTLPKLDPSIAELASKYEPITIPRCATYFIAKDDEVIDNSKFIDYIVSEVGDSNKQMYVYDDGGHRFAGEYFERVINYIKSL